MNVWVWLENLIDLRIVEEKNRQGDPAKDEEQNFASVFHGEDSNRGTVMAASDDLKNLTVIGVAIIFLIFAISILAPFLPKQKKDDPSAPSDANSKTSQNGFVKAFSWKPGEPWNDGNGQMGNIWLGIKQLFGYDPTPALENGDAGALPQDAQGVIPITAYDTAIGTDQATQNFLDFIESGGAV